MSTSAYLIMVAIYLLGGCILYIYGSKLLARIMKKTLAKRIALSASSVLSITVLALATWMYVYT